MNIVLVIGGLSTGGTERQVSYLASGLAARGHGVRILLLGTQKASDYSVAENVVVTGLSLTKPSATAGAISVLRKAFREADLVYSFLDFANALCALIRPRGGAPLVWGLRASNTAEGLVARISLWLCQRLWRRPRLCIGNCQATLDYYAGKNVIPSMSPPPPPPPPPPRPLARRRRLIASATQLPAMTIFNGIPSSFATPAEGVRSKSMRSKSMRSKSAPIREQHNIPAAGFVVLIVARFTVEKRHDLVLRLAALWPAAYFVMVGSRITEQALKPLAGAGQNLQNCRFIEHSGNVAQWLLSADVLLSAADHEGFPNNVLEAMACEVPVVATAVGGVPELLGAAEESEPVGWMAPAGDVDMLLEQLQNVEQMRQGSNGVATRVQRAHARACNEFGVDRMVLESERALQSLLL